MTPSDMHHAINRQLAQDLLEVLRAPEYIYVNSLEPERDRLPVARGLIESMAEALTLTDRKVTHMESIARTLAACLRDILQSSDLPARSQTVSYALQVLGRVDEALQ